MGGGAHVPVPPISFVLLIIFSGNGIAGDLIAIEDHYRNS